MRACGSLGPFISGSGKIEGIVGTALAEPSPDAASASSAAASSSSFSSHTPIASAPAAPYAATSSANVDVSVVTCEIEKDAPMQGV
jgi:hypothetical protein